MLCECMLCLCTHVRVCLQVCMHVCAHVCRDQRLTLGVSSPVTLRLACLFLFFFLFSSVCVFKCVHMHAETWSWYQEPSSNFLPPYSWRQDLSIEPRVHWYGYSHNQHAWKISISVFPGWNSRQASQHTWTFNEFWGSELWPSHLYWQALQLSSQSSPQPQLPLVFFETGSLTDSARLAVQRPPESACLCLLGDRITKRHCWAWLFTGFLRTHTQVCTENTKSSSQLHGHSICLSIFS